jgi:hypothetical protein
MAFRTKLDYSDNRQINQRQRTFTNLEGGSIFGVAFSALTSGVGTTCSASTEEYVSVTGTTFSSNTLTTNFTWSDSRMSLGEGNLSAITPSNSATTQDSGNVFVVDSSTTIDGNNVNLTYSGVALSDVTILTMTSVGASAYTGTVRVDIFEVLSACSLDYTGRTIWSDNPEITRTKKLIVTENPVVGYVWTCTDTEGLGGWSPSSGGTSGGTDTFVTGSSWNGSTLTLTRNDGGTIVSTYTADTALWTAGTANNTAALIGYTGLTNNPDTAYFKHGVTDMISGSTWSGNTINMNDGANSPLTISHEDQFGGTEFLKLDSTITLQRNSSNYLTISNGAPQLRGNSSVTINTPQKSFKLDNTFGLVSSIQVSSGFASMHAFKSNKSAGVITNSDLHAGALQSEISFGIPKSGSFDYDGVFGSGLGKEASGVTSYDFYPVFISAPRSQARDTTSYDTILNSVFLGGSDHTMYSGITDSGFVGGTGNTISSGVVRTVVIGGKDITGDTSDMVYVPDLVIDGLNSTDPLATDANGKIIAGASDARLKTNVKELNSALDTVLNLRGVSFEWTPESNMGAGVTKYGLIAQEVQKVIPDMVRLRAKTDDTLTLSYTEIVPWLIEAVKELASDDSPLIKREELILETQTIASEDNNIELNFNGTNDSALNGGMKVIKGINDTTDSEFKINSEGDWVTNNYIIPFGLVLPRFTPSSTNDEKGKLGEVTRDNDHIYIKSEQGWKRTKLETF